MYRRALAPFFALVLGSAAMLAACSAGERPMPTADPDASELEQFMVEAVGGLSFTELEPFLEEVMQNAYDELKSQGLPREPFLDAPAHERLERAQARCDAVAEGATWLEVAEETLEPVYAQWDEAGGPDAYYNMGNSQPVDRVNTEYMVAGVEIWRVSPILCPDQYDEALEAAMTNWHFTDARTLHGGETQEEKDEVARLKAEQLRILDPVKTQD